MSFKRWPTTLSDNTFSKAIHSLCAPTAVPKTMTDPSAGLSRWQPRSSGNVVALLLGDSQTRFARKAWANYSCWCLPRPMSLTTGSRTFPPRSFLQNRHLGFASPLAMKVLSNVCCRPSDYHGFRRRRALLRRRHGQRDNRDRAPTSVQTHIGACP